MARNKPRAWSNLKGQLPDYQGPDDTSERRQAILKEADERAARTMDELAAEWDALEEEEEFEELARKERNIKYAALEIIILRQLEKVKEVAGTDMWRGDGQTFSPKFTPRPIVSDPAALMAWIKAKSLESLLTLSTGRLASLVKEALDMDAAAVLTPAERAALQPGDPASGAPPPGVTTFLQTSVHHTSTKTKRARRVEDADGPF
jgi:hypothetical protein